MPLFLPFFTCDQTEAMLSLWSPDMILITKDSIESISLTSYLVVIYLIALKIHYCHLERRYHYLVN